MSAISQGTEYRGMVEGLEFTLIRNDLLFYSIVLATAGHLGMVHGANAAWWA
ncbi:hypothetical protein [Cupriavidus pauculus]|uniref:hypothetical protein n=1 Tax=Cupriavidus pauculus TaxID=82633 RepID=UPI001EE356A4|nr:hypothetical protein [Cupriavidus pauculus]GJG96752.1 hypothetical protein CBA19C6_19705 [Cupriavidus pauculus]